MQSTLCRTTKRVEKVTTYEEWFLASYESKAYLKTDNITLFMTHAWITLDTNADSIMIYIANYFRRHAVIKMIENRANASSNSHE